MRLNEPSDGVILNGKGVRKQNKGYREVQGKGRITGKNPPKIAARSGEHYIEDDKFYSGDQRVRGGSLFYTNRTPKKPAIAELIQKLMNSKR